MPRERAESTCFKFHHKVFNAEGVHFCQDLDKKSVLMRVQLGQQMAAVHLDSIAREFKLNRGSADWDLLQLLPEALKFVKEIRPGDDIPSEILDGTASWSFGPEHAEIAAGRVWASLIAWNGTIGKHQPQTDDEFRAFPQSAAFINQSDVALDELCKACKLPGRKETRLAVEPYIRELAYIEALRHHFARLFKVPGYFEEARTRQVSDRTVREEYDRILALSEKPFNAAKKVFRGLDERIKDPVGMIKNGEPMRLAIRKARDKLRLETVAWNRYLKDWEDMRAEASDDLRRETYRFLAERFAFDQNYTID